MSSVVMMASGGIKSAVAAAHCAPENDLVVVHINYGQRSAACEHTALVRLLPFFSRARLMPLTLSYVRELQGGGVELARPGVVGTSAKSDAKSSEPTATSLTPAMLRGLFPSLMTTAVHTAASLGARRVVCGMSGSCGAAHLGLPPADGAHDLRREFVHAFNLALECLVGPSARIKVETPLIDLSDTEIVRLADEFKVPLGDTWTCLNGGLHPCEVCDTCQSRRKAFLQAGVLDPAAAGSPAAAR